MADLGGAYPPQIPVETIDRKSPIWTLHNEQWNVLNMLYEAGIKLKNFGSNLLMKRPKELYDVYQERYRRLTYEDLLANCIRWYMAKLFQAEPKIDGKTEDPRFAQFLQDCDHGGSTFVKFGRDVFECMMLYQAAFVLIDKARSDEPVNTRADEQRLGLDQPYLVLYDPRQAINWEVDEYGNLQWIVFKTLSVRQDGPIGKCTTAMNWFIFDKSQYVHYQYEIEKPPADMSPLFNTATGDWAGNNKNATLMDQGPHVLSAEGRVPVRVCSLPMSLWFANAAYLQLCEHLDYLNSYAWKLFLTCHPQLVIYSAVDVEGQTLGETSFLQFAKDDKVEYLEPNGASFAECRKYLDLMRMEIYRSFHLQAQGKDSSASADGASGYSKELEMAPAADMLSAFGAQVKSDQQLILQDFKLAAGLPMKAPENIPDVNGYKFETRPALAVINLAQAVLDLGLADKSPTLEKVLDKEAATAIIDGQNEDTKNKIMAELDAAPSRKDMRDQAQQDQMNTFAQKFQKSIAGGVIKSESEAVEQ